MPMLTVLHNRNLSEAAPPPAPPGPSLRVIVTHGAARTQTDISGMVRSVTSTVGRQSQTASGADPGVMTLECDDTLGVLDPENTSSPLYPNLIPRRDTTVTVQHLFRGVYHPVGFGIIDSLERTWGPAGRWSETTISTVDQSQHLQDIIPKAGQTLPMQTVTQRINELLLMTRRGLGGFRFRQLSPAALPALDTSNRMLGQIVTDGSASLWSYATDAAFSDDGLLFFDQAGVLTFHGSQRRLLTPLRETYGDATSGEVDVEPDLTYRLSGDDLIAEAAFTAVDGTTTAVADEGGVVVVSEGRGVSTQLADRAQVSSRAQMVYARESVPRRLVDQVSLNALSGIKDYSLTSPYPAALAARVSRRVRLTRRPPGGGSTLTADYYIDGITHSIVAGEQWLTTLRLVRAEPLPQTFWVLGVDGIGSSGSRITW